MPTTANCFYMLTFKSIHETVKCIKILNSHLCLDTILPAELSIVYWKLRYMNRRVKIKRQKLDFIILKHINYQYLCGSGHIKIRAVTSCFHHKQKKSITMFPTNQ